VAIYGSIKLKAAYGSGVELQLLAGLSYDALFCHSVLIFIYFISKPAKKLGTPFSLQLNEECDRYLRDF
jgi:hypothetical protein